MAAFKPLPPMPTEADRDERIEQLHNCLEELKTDTLAAHKVLASQLHSVSGQLEALTKAQETGTAERGILKDGQAKMLDRIGGVENSVVYLSNQLNDVNEANQGKTAAVEEKVDNLTTAFGLSTTEKKRKRPIALMGQWEVVAKVGGGLGGFFFVWKLFDFVLPFAITEFWGCIHFLVVFNEYVKK